MVVVTTTPSTSKRRVRLRVFFFRLLNSISSLVRGVRRAGNCSDSNGSISELTVVPLLTVLKLRPEAGLLRSTTSLSSTSMTESLLRLLRLPVVPVLFPNARQLRLFLNRYFFLNKHTQMCFQYRNDPGSVQGRRNQAC